MRLIAAAGLPGAEGVVTRRRAETGWLIRGLARRDHLPAVLARLRNVLAPVAIPLSKRLLTANLSLLRRPRLRPFTVALTDATLSFLGMERASHCSPMRPLAVADIEPDVAGAAECDPILGIELQIGPRRARFYMAGIETRLLPTVLAMPSRASEDRELPCPLQLFPARIRLGRYDIGHRGNPITHVGHIGR